MSNPFLKTKKSLAVYIGIWLVAMCLEILVLYIFLNLNFKTLAVDVFLHQGFLALMLLTLVYPIQFFSKDYMKMSQVLFNHLLLFALVMLIWIPFTQFILSLIITVEIDYINTLKPIKILLGVFTYLVFVLILQLENYSQKMLNTQKAEQRLLENLKETELALIRNQMNPHFLFNSLNSISSLTLIDPHKAHNMIISLSEYLRYTVSFSKDKQVRLDKELEMSKAYLDIEKIRFGEKLLTEIDISKEAESCLLPSLLLQPLFENALKHGVHNSLKPEKVSFKAVLEDNFLKIELKNTVELDNNIKIGTKSGLKNTAERLKIMYKNTAYLQTSLENNTFLVKISIPQNTDS